MLSGEIGQNAQRGIMAEFKKAHFDQHNYLIEVWLDFDQLELIETEESAAQPTGCSCDCAGCDQQGYHCHKESRGCYQ